MKKILLFILFFLYLITWLGFGFYYRYSANQTLGRSFIFQDNIKQQFQINEIKDKLKIHNIRDKTIIPLLSKGDDEKYIYSYIKGEKMDKLYTIQQLGTRWANYYEEKFVSVEKLTHFKIKNYKEENALYSMVISLYKVEKSTDPNNSAYVGKVGDNELFEHVRDMDIEIKCLPDVYEFIKDKNFEFIPIKGVLRDFLETSYITPGIDWIDFEIIKNGQFSYPLIHFLYFSAVTITTLGYGDILPNSSSIRLAVMLETFAGLILMGSIVSIIFIDGDKLKKISNYFKILK